MAGSELFATLLLMLMGMIVVVALMASVLGPSNIMTYYMFMAAGAVYVLLVLLTYMLWYRSAAG
ncbi:MAG: hypothetical protein GXO09_05700 [Crenarchaeota archaeon]|nr:hypothetical protein [Thermoproteota archaeon]